MDPSILKTPVETTMVDFFAAVAVFLAIALWYLLNEAAGADGERGWLALKPDPAGSSKAGKRYRLKPRVARRAGETRDLSSLKAAEGAAPAYREGADDEEMRRRFLRQDEARYRVRDRIAPKPGAGASDS